MNYIGYLLPLIPLATAPAILIMPSAERLTAYLFYCLLFTLWWAFLSYVFNLKNQDCLFLEKAQYRSSLKVIIPASLVLLLSITLLRRTVEEFEFILIIAVLFLKGFLLRITHNRQLGIKLSALFLTMCGCSFCSFYLILGNYSWQSIVLSITSATLPFIPWIAHALKQSSKKGSRNVFMSRIYSIFLAMFPATVLTFAQLYYLPRFYSFIAISFFTLTPLLKETRKIEEGSETTVSFAKQSTYYPILIISLLIIIKCIS